ncbi:MAG: polyribonucleotide nucleotidyltransferase [Chloroflexota bacterium]
MTEPRSFQCEIAGRCLSIEIGRLAGQAGGAVTVRFGDTVVLATATAAKEAQEGKDFLPLTVDYEERHYAAGKIPGGFIRREGRPTQEATLSARLTDRSLRPLFPKGWYNETQVIVTVLSADQENSPDILSIIGASAALMVSEIPFTDAVGACRIGYLNHELVVNPTLVQVSESLLEVVVASTREAIVMVEAGAREVPEELMMKAIRLGHEVNQGIIRLQEELQKLYGKPKVAVVSPVPNTKLIAAISPVLDEKLLPALALPDKSQREQALYQLQEKLVEDLAETFPEKDIIAALESRIKSEVRRKTLAQRQRLDGRGLTDIRPISCEIGLLPRTHGSGLFTRGQTQVLSITTLGSTSQEQKLDGLGIETTKRFMHHYNFPPFSTGEVKRTGSPGRREIGHGALAERAIEPVIPGEEDFPYTIRVVSEVLSSNGSTSMASTCATILALMDAGVPIKAPVAGIAMGLVTGEPGEYVILTDIEGLEDAYGDMDFKVAGSAQGITAVQLDIKLKGVSVELLGQALSQARGARLFILERMQQTIASSRPELSPYAPRVYKITINPDKIGAVIGTGGKTIRSITEETKATIDIQNDGTVLVASPNKEAARKAIERIESLTKEVEVGAIYTGKVTRVVTFGAFVEILPGKEGLVHISEMADHRVINVEDEVKVGDEITVKAIDIDNLGRINLSRRAVFEKGAPEGEARRREPRPAFPPRRPHEGPPSRPPGRPPFERERR